MKTLEELGISPAPWHVVKAVIAECGKSLIVMSRCRGHIPTLLPENARLIAAAPELYECLYEAVEFTCDNCNLKDGKGECTEGVCPWVKKWRAALAKAAGESEVAK